MFVTACHCAKFGEFTIFYLFYYVSLLKVILKIMVNNRSFTV